MLALLPTIATAQQPAATAAKMLPKVVLAGDSIRMSYASIVAAQLKGEAIVISSNANGGDSSNSLKNLEAWVIRQQPDVVHFNNGIHDTKKSKTTGRFQVPPATYKANLRSIVQRIRKETGATVIFATTTPVIDSRAAAHRQKASYQLLQGSVVQYNQLAREVMDELKAPVNDLHTAVLKPAKPHTMQSLLGADGIHLTAAAKELLGKQVADTVRKHLPK